MKSHVQIPEPNYLPKRLPTGQKSRADIELFKILVKKSGVTDHELHEIEAESLKLTHLLTEKFAKASELNHFDSQSLKFNANNFIKDLPVPNPPVPGEIFIPANAGIKQFDARVVGEGSGYNVDGYGIEDNDITAGEPVDFNFSFTPVTTGNWNFRVGVWAAGFVTLISQDDWLTDKNASYSLDARFQISQDLPNPMTITVGGGGTLDVSYVYFEDDVNLAQDGGQNIAVGAPVFGATTFEKTIYLFANLEVDISIRVAGSVSARGYASVAEVDCSVKHGGVQCFGLFIWPS